MPTVLDSNVNPKPPLWKVALNLLLAALTSLKGMGVFFKKDGPQV